MRHAKHNYLIDSKLGGGNLSKSPLSELAISRFSVRAMRLGSRILFALFLYFAFCACIEPIPADLPEELDTELDDSTSVETITPDTECGDSLTVSTDPADEQL